jgi:hypothetical protein
MKVLKHGGPVEVVAIGLGPGEMLLESITQACREHDIKNGAVVSGIGTLKQCRMHFIEHTDFPSTDRFYTVEKPLELLSVSGLIANGEPHLHVVVSCRDEQVWAGHLEDGSEVAYLAEVAILKFNDLRMARHLDPTRKIRLLGPAED